MSRPIILDCDPGHDDAIALILACASPSLDIRAVTTSAGNQTPDKTVLKHLCKPDHGLLVISTFKRCWL